MMARIRTIKPELPQSESMGRVSRDARLLFILLWTIADDSGRLRGNSRMLASLLFPYDDDAPGLIDDWIAELEAEGCIVRYLVEGSTYIQVCNWLNHQKIDRPSESKIPEFVESSRILANPRESSSLDQRTKDQGPRIKGPKEKSGDAGFSALRALCSLGVDEKVAKDWIATRKVKLTQTALDGFVREAQKAGMSPNDAATMCCQRGWRGFKAEWAKDVGGNGSKHSFGEKDYGTGITDL